MSWSGIERRTVKKVLYFDDCDDELSTFKIVAESYGFEVVVVRYASDFIREFETGEYAAAFIDFLLSISDGVAITRLLRKERAPNTKLFIFTAYDIDLVRKKVNGDKINGVLNKLDGIPKALAGVVND